MRAASWEGPLIHDHNVDAIVEQRSILGKIICSVPFSRRPAAGFLEDFSAGPDEPVRHSAAAHLPMAK
jgi:hypothetical protein